MSQTGLSLETQVGAWEELLATPGIFGAYEAISPPITFSEEAAIEHGTKLVSELGGLGGLHAILLPDLDAEEMGQDATKKEFRKPTWEPSEYVKILKDQQIGIPEGIIPIPFRRTVKSSLERQLDWLRDTYQNVSPNIVFVGGDIRSGFEGPNPTDLLKHSQSLNFPNLFVGGIIIPTR